MQLMGLNICCGKPKSSGDFRICSGGKLAVSPSSTGVSNFIRPHLKTMQPYTPILPFEVLSEQTGRDPAQIIKLDANENPYGPPGQVLQALGQMQFPNIYPDPESRNLRKALEEWTGVSMESILVGCGCDELIDLLMRCFLEPGDSIIDCPPTFGMYTFGADVNNAHVVTVPRCPNFQIDVEGIKDAVVKHKPKLVFIASPNNPDGSLMLENDLLSLLKLPIIVVLDEAYIEFSNEESRLHWVSQHQNLVVLRTFSKCAGIAGLRVGYGAFPEWLIPYMWRAKQPYNVSAASEIAACVALQNLSQIMSTRDLLVEERSRLFGMLQGINFLEPYPSQSNFILCKVEDGVVAEEVKEILASKFGVMVRHYAQNNLKNYLRISVGKPEHTDYLRSALETIGSKD